MCTDSSSFYPDFKLTAAARVAECNSLAQMCAVEGVALPVSSCIDAASNPVDAISSCALTVSRARLHDFQEDRGVQKHRHRAPAF